MAITTRLMPAVITASAQGASTPGMRAGFEIEVERCAARAFAGLLDGQHLGMLPAFVSVRAAANDLARRLTITAPTQGFGDASAMPSPGKLQRLLHELLVAYCL